MTPNTGRNRRVVVAAAVAVCAMVGAPAAYAAGAATAGDDKDTAGSSRTADPGSDSGSGSVGSGKQGLTGSDETSGSGSGSESGSAGEHDHSSGSSEGAGQDSDQDSGQGSGTGGDQPEQGENQDGQKQDGEKQDGEKQGGEQKQSAADVLAADCEKSELQPHDGFEKGPRCVSTAFGEVGSADKNPSLLITKSPTEVSRGEGFQLTVSTRNLVRDRFLGAAQGGYYKESSVLDGQGLQRGHFHTACRMLDSTDAAPDAAPAPLFFKATEDNKGGATPDSVTIDVPGVEQTGQLQCSSWAGDGSHRMPMMQRANQTPAFDSVRIEVK
ncbi:hypothetical protein [Pseudonocardia phyllosphaerae]|uniref:hypothetical protein n=1 Tax=Pseudonocardia phyllosphaerae TaxID=3390502 RepID=UPI00397B8E13